MLLPFLLMLALAGKPNTLPEPIDQSIECLAQNIVHEAPNETYQGKLAVAQVTINRMHSGYFRPTICGVVYQKGQFSWTYHPQKYTNAEYVAARQVAIDALNGKRSPIIGNALYFHNTSVTPIWTYDLVMVQQIGTQKFYALKKRSAGRTNTRISDY